MRLLDLFCGAGGAARGYQEAGFYVVGVDIVEQPDYCGDEFWQMDALEMLETVDQSHFDLIHASPPCQEHVMLSVGRWGKGSARWPDLIGPTRDLLERPYVIENVVGARNSLHDPMLLTGEMFGLTTSRPRLFELGGWFAMSPPKMRRMADAVAVYGKPDGRRLWTRADGSELRAWSSVEEGREALQVPWMTDELEIREAIPPAYSRFIGEQFLSQLDALRDGGGHSSGSSLAHRSDTSADLGRKTGSLPSRNDLVGNASSLHSHPAGCSGNDESSPLSGQPRDGQGSRNG